MHGLMSKIISEGFKYIRRIAHHINVLKQMKQSEGLLS